MSRGSCPIPEVTNIDVDSDTRWIHNPCASQKYALKMLNCAKAIATGWNEPFLVHYSSNMSGFGPLVNGFRLRVPDL